MAILKFQKKKLMSFLEKHSSMVLTLTFSNKFPTNPKYSLKPSVGMRIMVTIVVRI